MLKSFITKFLYNWFCSKYSLYMFVLESLGFSGIYINLLLFFKYYQENGEFFIIHCYSIYLLFYADSLKWFKVYHFLCQVMKNAVVPVFVISSL